MGTGQINSHCETCCLRSTCLDVAEECAVQNWMDANPGVDPYTFSSYDTDNGGTFGAWQREMTAWAQQYIADDMVGCVR